MRIATPVPCTVISCDNLLLWKTPAEYFVTAANAHTHTHTHTHKLQTLILYFEFKVGFLESL
jgi:hypothetical protein